MWDLYRTLRHGLKGKSQEYLLDEILQMMENISVEEFKSALRKMYGGIDSTSTPVELSLLLTRGIKKNNLFAFSDFVKVISGSPNRK